MSFMWNVFRSLFARLVGSFFLTLCYLFFFELQILVTPLVSSCSSYPSHFFPKLLYQARQVSEHVFVC